MFPCHFISYPSLHIVGLFVDGLNELEGDGPLSAPPPALNIVIAETLESLMGKEER